MANNSTVTKLLQVSEEAAPAVHIPVVVNNELFVLTQQDVRRVEDTRYMSYNRWTNNQTTPAAQLTNLFAPQQTSSPMQLETVAQQTEASPSICATVAKQLKWSKSSKSFTAYPITYSVATSTSGLNVPKRVPSATQRAAKTRHCGCQTNAETTSKACNTEHKRQPKLWLKKQRSNDSLSECSCPAAEATQELESKRKKTVMPPYCEINEDYEHKNST